MTHHKLEQIGKNNGIKGLVDFAIFLNNRLFLYSFMIFEFKLGNTERDRKLGHV